MSSDRDAIDTMLSKVREAISQCRGPSERRVLEELVAEAEGWSMRLDEMDKEEEGEDERE